MRRFSKNVSVNSFSRTGGYNPKLASEDGAKLGAAGALYAGAERVSLPAAPAARVEDTTGAGDALCAGFLAAWLSGAAPAAALRRGVEVAARAVECLGARPGS